MSLGTALRFAPYAAIAALLLFLSVTRIELSGAKAEVGRHRACLASVKGDPKAKPSVITCDPAIAQADALADMSQACDQALTGGNDFAMRASCTAPVKILAAKAITAANSLASAKAALGEATLQQDQAVARAEARGRTQAERQSRAKVVREHAPRDGDGLSVYDADSLRRRWGQAPQ